MQPFDFQPRTRIVFGPGKIELLGTLAAELGGKRALLVSDPGIVAAGHAARAIASLEQAGLATTLFDRVAENPTTHEVADGVGVAQAFRPDLLVGLGGGSSMDCAKGINFIYSCGGQMADYWGRGKATSAMLPCIAVPTTAGTGSETQSFALISDAKTHAKMACGDPKAACRVAILDPLLTLTQPRRVTALTGIDALAHALETYVTRTRNPVSLAFSREAWRLLAANFGRVLDEPGNLEARGAMQLGASLAGLAIENSMLGATHALANPLTAHHDLAHGEAIGILLPHVIRFNGHTCEVFYRELLQWLHDVPGVPAAATGSGGLADFVGGLVAKADLGGGLASRGVDQTKLSHLAAEASQQWTAGFNPRSVNAEDLEQLYQSAFL